LTIKRHHLPADAGSGGKFRMTAIAECNNGCDRDFDVAGDRLRHQISRSGRGSQDEELILS
jgi:hypothetical protein